MEIYTTASDARFELLEDPNLTDGNLPLAKVNRNRPQAISIPSQSTLWSNPTNITGGFKIEDIRFGSGDRKIADSRSTDLETILNLDRPHIFRLTNLANETVVLYLQIFWYESTNITV